MSVYRTLNDYPVDYRVDSVHILHVARVVVAVGPLQRGDRHFPVFGHLLITVPGLDGPETL